nr:hypothetical protein [Tanacetum cinerariifolium]
MFPRCLEQHVEGALVHKTMEIPKRININCPLLKEIRQTDDYAKQIKNLVVKKPRTSKNEDIKMNQGESQEEIDCKCSMLDQGEPWQIKTIEEPKHDIDLLKIELILDDVLDKLDDDWFHGIIHDEDDLDGIVNYMELKSHDDFVDINDEAYKERMFKLLGITYKNPSSILIKKVEVTRYMIGLRKSYTRVRILGIEEMPGTSANIVAVRVELMKEVDIGGSVQKET